jgi:hypothetical protein
MVLGRLESHLGYRLSEIFRGCPWFLQAKYRDSNSYWATTASFHIFSIHYLLIMLQLDAIKSEILIALLNKL